MTKIKDLLSTMDRVHAHERELMIAKNHDYSGEKDCLSNIKACEVMGICAAETGILTRMLDKFQRIINLEKTQAMVKDESSLQDINDLRNYLVFLYHVKMEKSEREREERELRSEAASGPTKVGQG